MTKVYLVKLSAWDTVRKQYLLVNLKVFTNKKKAQIYAEYKNLQAEIKKPTYLSTYDEIKYIIEEYDICTTDFSEELVELQTKNLPY